MNQDTTPNNAVFSPPPTSGEGAATSYSKPPAPPLATPAPISVPPVPKRNSPIKLIAGIVIALVFVAVGILVASRFLAGKKSVKNVEITWWGLWEDVSVYSEVIAEYQSLNPKVTINYIKQSPQDYRERLTNALAKGSGPDIFTFHNSWVPMFSKDLDNLPSSFMSAADMAQNYYPVMSADLASGVGIVGVPLGFDALTLFINEDIFKNEGIDPPTTWDDLREKAKLLTKTENGVIQQAGIALGRTENIDHWPEILALMMLQNGADLSNPEGILVEDAILFFTIFSRVDGVWDATLPPSTTAFASGKLAMYFGPSWRAFNIKEQNPDINFRTIPLPQLAKEDPSEPNVSYASYWANGVWTRSEKKTQSWDFLKFLSTRESLEKVYKQAATGRGFGQIYPRTDMANFLIEHPVLGSIVKLAPEAQSWYLADRTFDGATGINSQLKQYFGDAINAVNQGDSIAEAMDPLSQGVKQVMTQYGLIK